MYNYKYNGKELQETGQYDFGARFYMPDIGRWGVVDPLADITFDTYGYANSNPIFYNDPTGMIGEDPKPDPKKIYGPKGGHLIEEVTIQTPLRAIASNPASVMPSNCLPCYSMQGMTLADLPSPPPTPILPGHYYDRGVDYMGPIDLAGMLAGDELAEHVGEQDAGFLMALANVVMMTTGAVTRTPTVSTTRSGNLWRVGAYNKMRGIEAGLDAHHVGQSAIMKKLVSGYDHKTAPTILVPKLGHTVGTGVVSRSTSGFTNARQVLARDIFELRRVYGDQKIPNSALQEVIQMNKSMYPNSFKK